MQVSPSRTKLLQDRRGFLNTLTSCQQDCLKTHQVRLVSFSIEIPTIDPLAVLQRWHDPKQHFFYWEKPQESLAMAAIAPELLLQVNTQRFTKTQQFLESSLDQAVLQGQLDCPFAGPHFFCGFTFFEAKHHHPPLFPSGLVFLPRWQLVSYQGQSLLVANFALEATSQLDRLVDALMQKLEQLQTHAQGFHIQPTQETIPFQCCPHTSSIEQSIQKTLTLIQTGELQKLVLAHPLDITTPAPLALGQTLHRLRQRYPECCVFAIGNGEGQIFWGASPERLVSLRDRHLVTDVLAGSAPRGHSIIEDISLGKKLLHNQKDGHEHQLVLEFICNQLRTLGMRPQTSSPAHLMQLANIQHLRTLVSATAPCHLQILDILAALHPTPAVAGTHRDRACDYIRQYEAFDRHLYAAPLGWINHRGDGEFAVGIRSALSDGCHTRLYAGAGIVAGSEPQKELAEVELKLRTLLEALV
ncbi:isochorismate synthase [Lyngbya confervoides]|uniref:isochorismate synthase n=1 Tax=Lyngbya confervoides BDU141951 TaxID=1574623 RepID=A0ABD4T565_9CYAN|nr:isochorismate synthase [Lyngbya confervoides]MCM1983729.1 isochorismate synthase [Lyngbya confervoides BDU141951]